MGDGRELGELPDIGAHFASLCGSGNGGVSGVSVMTMTMACWAVVVKMRCRRRWGSVSGVNSDKIVLVAVVTVVNVRVSAVVALDTWIAKCVSNRMETILVVFRFSLRWKGRQLRRRRRQRRRRGRQRRRQRRRRRRKGRKYGSDKKKENHRKNKSNRVRTTDAFWRSGSVFVF